MASKNKYSPEEIKVRINKAKEELTTLESSKTVEKVFVSDTFAKFYKEVISYLNSVYPTLIY